MTGNYSANIKVAIPAKTNLCGSFDLRHQIEINLGGILSSDTRGVAIFGNPSVVGLPLENMTAYAASDDTTGVVTVDGDIVSFLQRYSSGLTFSGFTNKRAITYSYTVNMPFTMYFTIPESYAWNITEAFLKDILRATIRFSSISNNMYADGGSTIEDNVDEITNELLPGINDSIDDNTQAVEDVEQSVDENTQAIKDQTEEQKGFFASIIEWITDFPQMILSIFVPSQEYFSTWLNDMKDFLTDHLGFLAYPFELLSDFYLMITAYPTKETLVFPGFSIMGHKVWDSVSYTIADMDNDFPALFEYIRYGTTIIMIGAFLLLCQRKFDEVLGGARE